MQVGLNIEPDEDDIGVGEKVFFPQGSYGGTQGNNTGGVRYHEGIVDSVVERDGVKHFRLESLSYNPIPVSGI